MKLQSVSNPTGEATEQIPKPDEVTEKRTTKPSENAVPSSKFARKRIVTGKSDEPLVPRGPGIRFETVLGADERTRIIDTEDAPWRMICALAIDGPWGSFIGTGWLAGPRTIVTAGHCVYDTKQMGGWANKIVISPGRDGNELPFDTVESTKFSTTNIWKSKEDPDFDVAAIHLSRSLGDELGWFQVASLTDDQLRNYMVNVSGYPGDRGHGTEQWWAKNRIREATPRRIFYEVDTFGGQSGGPVYIYESVDKPPVVLGIHAYGIGASLSGTSLNSAPRIIPEVVTQIQAWIDQDNAAG
jgi:V8-like Glu-specific endopeptidase